MPIASFMRPGWKPGKDWTHRIDAVPTIGRAIDVRFPGPNAREADAIVVPASPVEMRENPGIGDWVIILCHGYRYPYKQIAFWRYR